MKNHHFYRFALLFFVCQFAVLFASAQTSQPVIGYVSIEGQKMGIFKGNAISEGNEGKIECIGFKYLVVVPHDAESGRSSGKRQHSPFVIVKYIDYSTPQLLQAAYTNETLKTVVIEFLKNDRMGRQLVYYRVTLTNATISQISQYGGTASADNSLNLNSNGGQFEDVSFNFESIQIDHLVGNTSVMDNWRR
jgi:type VI secretion system secreted protein Hcp